MRNGSYAVDRNPGAVRRSGHPAALQGRYRVQQEEPAGVLAGCLRLIVRPDATPSSDPAAVVDLPVDDVPVVDGETVFIVDLTLD